MFSVSYARLSKIHIIILSLALDGSKITGFGQKGCAPLIYTACALVLLQPVEDSLSLCEQFSYSRGQG